MSGQGGITEADLIALRQAFQRIPANVIKDLEDRYYIHGSTFKGDQFYTAFSEGQRTVVLYIKQMMETVNEQPKEKDNANAAG